MRDRETQIEHFKFWLHSKIVVLFNYYRIEWQYDISIFIRNKDDVHPNLCNVTPILMSQNPKERICSVWISLLVVTLLCNVDFVFFHNVTCYTTSLLSCIHVNTTNLLNIMCTMVATCVLSRRLECIWYSVFPPIEALSMPCGCEVSWVFTSNSYLTYTSNWSDGYMNIALFKYYYQFHSNNINDTNSHEFVEAKSAMLRERT